MDRQWELLKDGKVVFQGKESACYQYIHDRHGYSMDRALRLEGYTLRMVKNPTPPNGKEGA